MLSSWTLDVGGVTSPLSLPAHFDRTVGDHPTLYTLRTDAAIPPDMRGDELALTIPYFAALVSLRADGVVLPDLDSSPLDRSRGTGPHHFVIPAAATEDGVVHLELVVDHRWTQSAWLDTVPRFSRGSTGDAGYVFVKLFNDWSAAAALAMILLVGFANGIIFLADRRRSAYGWFTLSSFLGAFYAAYALGLTQPLFGAYDPTVMGGAVTLSGLSTVRFTASVFGRRHVARMVGIFALWSLARDLEQRTLPVDAVPVAVHHPDDRRRGRVQPGPPRAGAAEGTAAARQPPRDDRLAGHLLPRHRRLRVVARSGRALSRRPRGEPRHRAAVAPPGGCARVAAARSPSADPTGSTRSSRDASRRWRRPTPRSGRSTTSCGGRSATDRSSSPRRSPTSEASTCPRSRLAPGDVVEGRYRVVGFVGSGGMAWVYEVERVTDGRRLALKLLHGRSSGAALARFAREAQLASEVAHPGIVAVVDVDLTQEGVLYIVMEYVDGKSLEQYLDDDPPMAWSIVVLRQLAEGLEQVHARGIVHRDLKPANVLIEEALEGPTAKIADFGVSMLLAEPTRSSRPPGSGTGSDVRSTHAGRVMGTPTYMAPELARAGAPVQPSIDMYAFGVMAHELLVGRPPFRDPLFVRAVHGRSLPPPTSLAVARPRLDRGVCELIDRCLSLDPQARPTAKDAVRMLRNARLESDPSSVPSIRAV